METPGTPANTAHPHTQTGTKAGPRPLTKAPRRIRAQDMYDRYEAKINDVRRDQGHWNDLIGATNDSLTTGAQKAQAINDAAASLAGRKTWA